MPLLHLFRVSLAGLAGLALLVSSHGDWTRNTPRFLLAWAGLVAAYALSLHAAGLFRAPVVGAEPATSDLKRALILLALVRMVMACGEPMLSDDVYRSVWEGRVQRASGNPFAWSDRPVSEKWVSLRDGHVYPRINHPDYAAIYPPAWQWAMRAVSAISDSVTAVKLFTVVCEVVFWAGLWQLLRARGMPLSRVLLAAASPLALVEIAGGGHSEPLGMAALVWAMVALERRATARAAFALALAFLSKLIPAILALSWVRRFRFRDYALMALVVAALSAPFVEGSALLSLQKYGDLWRFNETLFAAASALAGSHRGGVVISMVALLAVGLVLARGESDIVRGGLIMCAALLLLMPNVLPWYALWLLVFLPASHPSPLAAAAFVFTLTAPLAYLVYPAWLDGGPWHLPWSIRAIEYGLPLLVFVLAAARPRRKALTARPVPESNEGNPVEGTTAKDATAGALPGRLL